jgi:ribonuclease G
MEILVQAVKEPVDNKGVTLTGNISLPGRYVVLVPNSKARVTVSRRIGNVEEKKRIRDVLTKILPPDIALIARTAAEGKSKRELYRDIKFLLSTWKRISKSDKKIKAPALIYQESDLAYRIVRDILIPETDEIIIDSKQEYKSIRSIVGKFLPELYKKVTLYKEKDLFDVYKINGEIEKILQSRVRLRSGGYLIIQSTEALTTIDVNTGKFSAKAGPEAAAKRVNKEAAVEVAKQLRLRDIGGIIIIDFIDMDIYKNRREVERTLKEALRPDKAKINVLSITKFGLVEMTRQRVRKNINKKLCQTCPYCEGRGVVKTPLTISIELRRKLMKKCYEKAIREINITSHPEVVSLILSTWGRTLKWLGKKYRKNIVFHEDKGLNLEKYDIVCK